jgi:hypothetical protein
VIEKNSSTFVRRIKHQHARKCYERMVDESQLALGDAQAGLRWIYFECEEYDHRQSLQIRKQLLGECDVKVGNS